MMKDFLLSFKNKTIQKAIIILLLLQISSSDYLISECNNVDSFENDNCFNGIIQLDHCITGEFSEDKYGNLFALYTADFGDEEANNRLLYGFKKDGRMFFPGNPGKEYAINGGVGEREDSQIIFLNLDENNKQYLLSTSSGSPGNTLTELYEIGENGVSENDITRSNAGLTQSVWGIPDSITSYKYSLLKVTDKNIYFFIFAESSNIKIIKFKFDSPNLNGLNKISTITATSENYNYNVISSFLIEEEELLVLFYILNNENVYSRIYYLYKNAGELEKINEEKVSNSVDYPNWNSFFKGIYLKDYYSAFIYSTCCSSDIKLNISLLKEEDDTGFYYFDNIEQEIISNYVGYWLYLNNNLNEFIKINDNRLAFITTESEDIESEEYYFLVIILIDINNEDYQIENIQAKLHQFDQNPTHMSAYIFNDFLVFSASFNDNYANLKYSALAFFGYPNGTDIDIPAFEDFREYLDKLPIEKTEQNNIYTFLNSKKRIENNIFGFVEVDKIRLVSIPREMLFYETNEDGTQQIGSPLGANSLFGENHVIRPNLHLTRKNDPYDLYYQYIVKEADYSDDDVDIEEPITSSKLYYGRTNRLSFKLCGEEICESDCSFEDYLNKECVITGTDEEVIETTRAIISSYDDYSKILTVGLSQGTFVEITNDKKDKLLDNDGNLAKIDLGKCGEKISKLIQN